MVNRFKALFVVGLVLGAVTFGTVIALDLAGSDGVEISDGVPVSSPNNNTVTVYGSTNISLEDFAPASDTVDIVTEDGNMTVTSAGDTRVAVVASDITGSQSKFTNIIAGSTWIEVNPEDKNPIEFRGDLNEFYYSPPFDLSTKTNQDAFISGTDGGTGSVRYSNFPANTQIVAYDKDTGNILDINTTTANGVGRFDIGLSSHTLSFATSSTTNSAPELSNFEPSDGTTIRWSNETLKVDVNDSNFPDGDDVTVNFTLDGSQVSSQTISSNQTVSYSATGLSEGDHTWSVDAEDSFGNTESSSDRTFTVEHYEPEATNLQPEGDQSTTPSEVSADVSDKDFAFDGDTLTVEIYIDGTLESTQTINSNQTVTTNIPSSAQTVGQHSYLFNVTDSYDNSINVSETWQNPGWLRIYDEPPPHDNLSGTTVNATVTGEFGTVDLGSTDTGAFNFSGLPSSETYVFTLDANNYFSRSFFVTDIFSNRTAFMLNTSEASVANRITVSDRTGGFSEGTSVLIDRVINTSKVDGTPDNGPQWVSVAGDRLGATEFFDVDLEQGTRYRFRVRNDDGDTRVLSEYSAKSDGQIDLKIGSVEYTFGNRTGYQWDVTKQAVSGGNYSITFAYDDNQNLTSRVDVTVKTRENGTVIDSGSFSNGPYGEVVYVVQVNNSTWQNNEFDVEWTAERDGKTIGANRYVGAKQPLNIPITGLWKTVGYAVMTFVLAFLVGAGAGPAAAILSVGVWSGFAVYIELAPPTLGAGATILVIAMGAVVKAQQTQQARGL